ncbi:hypothetical protein NPIL_457341, partial [Nephila pilipes]
MKPGALFLYIDNAGGGFHQLIKEVAKQYSLEKVILQNFINFKDITFNVKRFNSVACFETDVSFHIWRKIFYGKTSDVLERKSFVKPQVLNNLSNSVLVPEHNNEKKLKIQSSNPTKTRQPQVLDNLPNSALVPEHNNEKKLKIQSSNPT